MGGGGAGALELGKCVHVQKSYLLLPPQRDNLNLAQHRGTTLVFKSSHAPGIVLLHMEVSGMGRVLGEHQEASSNEANQEGDAERKGGRHFRVPVRLRHFTAQEWKSFVCHREALPLGFLYRCRMGGLPRFESLPMADLQLLICIRDCKSYELAANKRS
jgi:hypothetical protein